MTTDCTPLGLGYLVNILRDSVRDPLTPSVLAPIAGSASETANTSGASSHFSDSVFYSSTSSSNASHSRTVDVSSLGAALPVIQMAPAPPDRRVSKMSMDLHQRQSAGYYNEKRPVKYQRIWFAGELHLTDITKDVSGNTLKKPLILF